MRKKSPTSQHTFRTRHLPVVQPGCVAPIPARPRHCSACITLPRVKWTVASLFYAAVDRARTCVLPLMERASVSRRWQSAHVCAALFYGLRFSSLDSFSLADTLCPRRTPVHVRAALSALEPERERPWSSSVPHRLQRQCIAIMALPLMHPCHSAATDAPLLWRCLAMPTHPCYGAATDALLLWRCHSPPPRIPIALPFRLHASLSRCLHASTL